jgi:hypothetical protein
MDDAVVIDSCEEAFRPRTIAVLEFHFSRRHKR